MPKQRRTRNRHFFRLSTSGTFIAIAILAFSCIADRGSRATFFVSAAHAQSKFEEDVHKFKGDVQKFGEDVHKKVQSLIEQLRHGDVPEGLAKTNGRIEATEIDVSAKYAGRLASVTVNEGDKVKAGQVVARITGPEYEAQLHTAQANVLVAKSALASAEAKIGRCPAEC